MTASADSWEGRLVEAGPAHAAALAAIHAAAFGPAECWDAESLRALLATPGCLAVVAGPGGLAMARVAGGEADLLTLAVVPGLRQRGLGGRLLQAACAAAWRRGAAAMLLEVGCANQPARRLYHAAGFRQVGRRARYYPDGGDALVLRLPLGPGEPR